MTRYQVALLVVQLTFCGCNPSAEIGECEPGESETRQVQPCGSCYRQSRICDDTGRWGEWYCSGDCDDWDVDTDPDVWDDPGDDRDEIDVPDDVPDEPVCLEESYSMVLSDYPSCCSEHAKVAWSGSEFGVAWWDPDSMRFTRVSLDGTVMVDDLDLFPIPSTHPPYPSDLLWSGSEYLLTWMHETDVEEELDVYLMRIAADGTPVDGGFMISTPGADGRKGRVDWSGNEYGAVWEEDLLGERHIMFSTLAPDGTTIVAPQSITPTGGGPGNRNWSPDIEWTGSDWAVVWIGCSSCALDITPTSLHFTRLDDLGTASGSINSYTTADTIYPEAHLDLAWSGSVFALTWLYSVDDTFVIPLDQEGEFMATEPLRLAGAGSSAEQPDILWTGSHFALAHLRGHNATLTLLGGDALSIEESIQFNPWAVQAALPDFAWTGSEFGFAHQEHSLPYWEIHFTKVGFCP